MKSVLVRFQEYERKASSAERMVVRFVLEHPAEASACNARQLAAAGVTAIELCAGFGNEGIARIQRAVGPQVAVGAVKFDFHPGLGFQSGDRVF